MGKKKLRSIKKFNKQQSKASFFNYAWADQYLKFNIGILQGKNIVCSRKGRIHLALIAKELLKDHGFDWHCDRIDNFIHKTSKLALKHRQKGDDSRARRREESLKLKPKISYEQWLEGLN